jgi:hypothetical protein
MPKSKTTGVHKKLSQAGIAAWLGKVADYGCVVSGESSVEVHHVYGRTYKHNKILIGHLYVLPLAVRYHNVYSNHFANVTHWPKRFGIEFGYQRDLFRKMCLSMIEDGIEVPISPEEMDAILDSPLR